MTDSTFALGLGVGTHNSNGEWLEIFFPLPILHPTQHLADALAHCDSNETLTLAQLTELQLALETAGASDHANLAAQFLDSGRPTVAVLLKEDLPPRNVPEAYLKLQLLSHRLVPPHGTNLEGLFGALPNVAWTSEGAIDLNELPARQLSARLRGEVLEVSSIDKFPKMTNYVVPGGVRIAHTARVRLGAYLGEGTTIMHEGFVNFNAGTEGPGMIEGRISAGVVVGSGSDLGGGCSTIGTLSGGGLFVTAGTKVAMLDANGMPVKTAKARSLAGKSDLLFRRNSTTGAVECLTNRSAVELNKELHSHN